VDLSGIIFVMLAVAWAVYLIPKALKHHDEVARTRSIDRFSTAMRVLARREPVNRRDARLVVAPPRGVNQPHRAAPSAQAADQPVPASAEPSVDSTVLTVSVTPAVTRARLEARRAAARAAARRRRHILTFLLLADVAMAVVAYLSPLSWWALAVPGLLTVLYLALCRTQVRRETLADFDMLAGHPDPAPDAASVTLVPRRGARVEAQGGTPRTPAASDTATAEEAEPAGTTEVVEVVQARVDEHGVTDFGDAEDTVAIPVAVLEAVALEATDGGTLWDPLPVTLPTYVTKPQAKRTVRTIDLGEPGTWTSGHTAEDSKVAAQAEAESTQAAAAAEAERQRAVGS
jgi:hypothetical protein